jgi:arylsulfatase A-like enzyme
MPKFKPCLFVLLLLQIFFGVLPAVAQTTADEGKSGAWYDPSHDGEGFLLEVLADGRAVVYWFSYDEDGNQRWFTGTGEARENGVVFDQLLAGSGAKFGDQFDSDDVVLADVGELSISWRACDEGLATYSIDGVGGSQVLTRVTGLAGLECDSSGFDPSPQSGSWFDHTHNGEGLVIQALDDSRSLVYWFSYDDRGNPAWFYGVGQLDGDTIFVAEMSVTSGGRFGAEFDPTGVQSISWGSLAIELGCDVGKLDYVSVLDEFGTGKQTLSRITSPGEPVCDEPEPPNILLVIADDLGLDAFGKYNLSGNPPATPRLDQLAEQGLLFENAWANPTCSPTRAGILTGKYAVRSGVLAPGDVLATSEKSLHSFIREHLPGRYSDAVIGKWHLAPNNNPDHPADMGISHFAGILGGGVQSYQDWVLTVNGEQFDQTEYSSSKLVDLAVGWVAEQVKPWFLWLAFNAPHTPFHLPPAELHDRELSGTTQDIAENPLPYYLASIEVMDAEFGRLLDSMDQETRENTFVIFIGDNGTPNQVAQEPFDRQHAKGSLYQGGVQVPMFVYGPGVNRKGQRESALVNSTDLFPTIASLAGVNVSEINDGISFTGLLDGEHGIERVFQYSEQIDDRADPEYFEWAVSDGDYKLIESERGEVELYRVSIDPVEAVDLVENGTAPGDKIDELQELVKLIQN